MSRIEAMLKRVDLKTNGTKAERIERLLAHFSSIAVMPTTTV
jgi:hypothetical protein